MYNGIKRLNAKDKHWYEFQDGNYTKQEPASPEQLKIIELYKDDESPILDPKNEGFYKGYLNEDGHVSGGRVSVLPDGKKLARGGFSLFANNLEFGNPKEHWAVKYQNPSGSFTYLYDEEHLDHEHAAKSKKVDKFIKLHPKITSQLKDDLRNEMNIEKLALLVLMESYLRVGNYEYFLSHQHQGLTTLMKKNMKMDDDYLYLDFIGKDGVPQKFKINLENEFLDMLRELHKSKSPDDFVFAVNEKPIHPVHFSNILHDYTGEHFYPHIIRSYYADKTSGNYLKRNDTATKKEVTNLYTKIAKKLGHKKYNKKKKVWQPDYSVTVKNYIRPEYVKELNSLYKK